LAASEAIAYWLSQRALQQCCAAAGLRTKLSSSWVERRVLWTFTTPAFLSGALVAPVTWFANTMLVNQPGGYAQMGILSAANQWRAAINFIPGVLAQFALPILSNLHGEGDLPGYARGLRWNLLLTAIGAGAAALPVVAGAPLIMSSYGAGFAQGWVVLVLSAATAFISSVNGVVGTAILSGGSVWAGLAFNTMWAVVFLGACRALVSSHGAIGLAAAMFAAYIAHTAWQGIYLRHRIRLLRSARAD